MRINKFIAQTGYTSRRKADDLIAAGRVRVNGKILDKMGYDVGKDDVVSIGGEILRLEEFFYYKLNKPVGYITSNYDPHNDKDLNDLMDIDERFFAAGRLDKDSRGLLIITNDGDFTNALIHPSQAIKKQYIVKVDRELDKSQVEEFKKGLDIGRGEITSEAEIYYLKDNTYKVLISQGYNRQIRRMFDVFKVKVIDLNRISIGQISIDDLDIGSYKKFNKEEMNFVSQIKK